MKNLFSVIFILTITLFSDITAQTWSSVSYPSIMVWSADELIGKLYVATGFNGVYEFDGTNWTLLSDFNNSSNTPHKSKSSIKKVGNLLYTGAFEFNTSGEGDIHTYDGSSWSLFQNTDFPYNANYRVMDFAEYNGTIFTGGQFQTPGSTYPYEYNLAKWNGGDWVSAGINVSPMGYQFNPVLKLHSIQNKLFITTYNKVYYLSGTTWDSLNTGEFTMIKDATVSNNILYLCGSFFNGTSGFRFAMYDGSTLTSIQVPSDYSVINKIFADASGIYATVQKIDTTTFQTEHTYLVKYNGSSWSDVSLLANYGDGLYPQFPGSEIADYNIIFRYGQHLYIGGRFAKINGQQIQSLARIDAPTGVSDNENEIPTGYNLNQNYPNPFNPSTTISYSLPNQQNVTLKVYDILGNEVASLVNKEQNAGIHSVDFSASQLGSGVYFYKLDTGKFSETKSMILIK